MSPSQMSRINSPCILLGIPRPESARCSGEKLTPSESSSPIARRLSLNRPPCMPKKQNEEFSFRSVDSFWPCRSYSSFGNVGRLQVPWCSAPSKMLRHPHRDVGERSDLRPPENRLVLDRGEDGYFRRGSEGQQRRVIVCQPFQSTKPLTCIRIRLVLRRQTGKFRATNIWSIEYVFGLL